ncbi:uncharacterized protein LOC111052063 isoform X2 [Nilaparvata lugens]|uniref:uncharacterized protein LOC111052063 isoform X2 n=1 Tax=Nilaparvata lugens TaxID=108931 RepID=UPI00193DFCE3|nr:uncharacterized protein LOC111052063 isoform X2 [Nilaparvata lugens]
MDKKSKQLVIDCIQLSSAKSSKYRDDIRPMIMWNQNAYGSELPVRSLMTPQQLNECFQHHFKIQMCGKEVSDVKPIYRVESTLTTRDENCKLAVVYYHDGVTVVENNGKLEIKATKFYNDQFQPIKFNGFTKPLIPLQSNNGAFREINYMPDVIRVTEVTHGSEDGNTYEIGSRWEYELVATADAVKCEKTVGRDYKKNYATKVSFVKDQKWTVISDLIDSRHFTDVRQTIYECKRGELVFLRIVNEYVEERLHESRYIYHHDGVEVGALVYPNSERTQTKIREVKFVDPSTKKILKYVGELYVVTEMKSIARRLYDGPASLIEGKLLAYEKLSDAKAMDVYSLDSLRTFMDGKEPIEKRLEAVRYGNDNKYLIYTNVEYMNGLSVYQVGRLWDAVYTADSSNPLICLEDRWNTKTVFESYNYKYILPRVIEFYGGEMYELDFHSMRQLISKIDLKVWICANRKDTLLRLELSMYIPSVNMSGYIHPHNIGIWLDDTQKNSVVLLRETFFVTPMSSKILKYEGALQLLESYVPDVGSWD